MKALTLCIVAAWLALGLFGRDPWKPDEAYTVGLVYHIVHFGDWVVPTLAGEPFMEKPPFFFVTAAGFASLLGGVMPLHEAARFATFFYVALTLLFVFLTARRFYGADAALTAVLILSGCLGFLLPAHLLITDNALIAGIAMALYGLAVACERPYVGGVLAGIGAGIAFLSKGLVGPGVIGLTAALLPFAMPWRTASYARALAIALAAFAPWVLIWPWLLYRESPALFHDWLVLNNFGRYTGSANLGPEHDHWMYVKILPWFALPALPLAGWNLWRAWRSGGAEAWRRPGIALPLAATCVIFGVLTSACNQRYLYAVPILVPLSLLAALEPPPRWMATVFERCALWLAVLGAALVWGGWLVLRKHWPASLADGLMAFRPGYDVAVDPLLPCLAFLLTLAAWCVMRARLDAQKWIVGWAAAVTLTWGLLNTLWLAYLDFGNSYRGVVAELAARLPKDAHCIANRNLGEPQRAMLEYFAGIVTYREHTAKGKSCDVLLVQVGRRRLAHLHRDEWTPIWNGSRPGDTNERFWLFRRQGLRGTF